MTAATTMANPDRNHETKNTITPIRGVLISPYPDPTEKKIERSPFFVRLGGHCCRGDLVGRTTLWIVFWVACKSKSLVAVACLLPGRAKDLSAPR